MPDHPLSPDNFLPETEDLSPAAFRRLVGRRARKLLPEGTVQAVTTEEVRRDLEEQIQLEVINLSADFLPASFLRDGADRSRSVCRIRTRTSRGQSFGTGFLIAPEVILTNNHVIRSRAAATDSVAEFGFEEGLNPVIVAIQPDRLFITNRSLDFTIVAADTSSLTERSTIPLLRNPATVTRHEPVNIIQHPRGRKKEIAIHENRVTRVRNSVIRYETDTEPGSSGSPIFNNDWELVALHHAGIQLDGGRAENEGIRASAIVNHLLGLQGSPESHHEAFQSVLDEIPDTSPFLGFFDVAGLGDPSLEVEVPDFRGTPDFADLGVWNIEHFNKRVEPERVEDVADVVGHLGLDILGLVEVEEPAMERLVTALETRGFSMGFELLNVRGSQDLAVIYDRDTSTVELRDDIAERHGDRLRARTADGKTAFPRPPLFAECTVSDGEEPDIRFLFMVVHLKAFGDAQSRARRRLAAELLAEIIADIRQTEGLPVVLGGDFNDRLNTDVFAPLQDTPDLFALTADDASTDAISFVGGSHRSLIDHIVVSDDVQLGEISGDDAAIVRLDKSVRGFSQNVSDHVPIVFRVILRDQPVDVEPTRIGGELQVEVPPETRRLEINFFGEGDGGRLAEELIGGPRSNGN